METAFYILLFFSIFSFLLSIYRSLGIIKDFILNPMIKYAAAIFTIQSKINEKIVDRRYFEYIERNLNSSGYKRIKNARVFLCIQEYLFFLSLLTLLIFLNSGFAFIFSLILSVLPLILLKKAVRRRHRMILLDLPFHIDMLTISIDAGVDFAAAMERIIKNGRPGPLKDEFEITLRRIKMGVSRRDALLEMADRINLSELSSIISAIIQADQMGTGLGNVLRAQSRNLRIKRFQMAEKLASEAPVKLLLPLMLFIFPSVFIILLSPIILRIIHSF